MRTPNAFRLGASFLIATAFTLLLAMTASAIAQEGGPVRFEDPALERAVRGQVVLDEGEPLQASDVAQIERLWVEWPDDADRIESLAGIEALTGLTYLNLRDHDVQDLQPLAGLTNLESLSLDRNRITNLEPLAGLQRLDRLVLSRNQIVDASGLAGLNELEFLDLSDNHLRDASGLAGLDQLSTLFLHDNALSDLSVLTELPNLMRVSLWGNPNLDTCAGSAPRQVIDELTARGVDVAYVERGAGGEACAEYASAAPVTIAMETGGHEESVLVAGGRLARLNPDGTRVVVSCVGTVQPVYVINEERGVYWYGLMQDLAQELSSFIAVHLLPDDPEVRYAVDVRVEEAGEEDVAGYTAQHYRVEWRPNEEEGGADHDWALMQEVWVAPELGSELQATGCYQVAAFLETFQLLQGTFSSQRFYGLAGSQDYGMAVTAGFPVRAVMYVPASGDTVVTEVTGVDAVAPAAGQFDLPEGLKRVNGLGEVF